MIELTKENFNENVIKSTGLVVVDYFADTCPPCRELMPLMGELEKEYDGKIKFFKYNAPLANRAEMEEQIFGLPTISIYQNGEKQDSLKQENATIDNIKTMITKYYS
jgi:thioredoxin 1